MSEAVPFLGAGKSLLGGIQGRAAARSDALAHEQRARNLELVARQQRSAHREALNESLSSIEAIRTGRNIGVGGSTELAISRENRRRSRDTEGSEQLSTRFAIDNANNQARNSRRQGRAALAGGFAGGIGQLATVF